MVQLDFSKHEVHVKLVYYGPGLSGKTTNLEVLHRKAPEDKKSKLLSVSTKDDRTLFFDFMTLDLGQVGNLTTKFQLYTVPGQVYYNATRKLVLMAADGVVFVADSQADKLEENIESFKNLEENLEANNLSIEKIPVHIQYNKRDLPDALPLDVLNEKINTRNFPYNEAEAVTGVGVFESLKTLARKVMVTLNEQFNDSNR
ncbi:MAG: GTPase domain-containing protein [Planctomycetota bacterium]|nr:GTPase domain-containing protein [Planctomycetota bacterium]